MYDELAKRLRDRASAFAYDGRPDIACDYEQAADAIEKLDNWNWWAKADKLIKMLETPHWIPVTEQLPEKTGKYLVCGQWRGKPVETWICELITFGNIKGWTNEARNPAVTYWMPLPEPPKEEWALEFISRT